MPELPEAEVCRDQLTRWSGGRTVDDVLVPDPAVIRSKMSSRPSDALPGGEAIVAQFAGQPSGPVVRHGKRLGWTFGPHAILIHLGMTGHWVKRPSGPMTQKSARLGFRFDDVTVWLMDRRRMGCVVAMKAEELDGVMRHRHGPDALDHPLTGPQLAVALRSRKPIKVVMMEQNRVAGIGNIHAAEACFRARIHPATPADDLTAEQWDRLATGILDQMKYTLDFVDPDAETLYVTSGAKNPFSVYKRTGQACARCTSTIVSDDLNGRTTYWCPGCQPRTTATT
ncbi:MAG: DNA-formamidopyrimidine glycosylase family protein [Myxococcota bacterium]